MTIEQFKLIADICSWLTLVAFILCLYKFPSRDIEIKLIALNLFTSLGVTAVIAIWTPHGKDINFPQNVNSIIYFLIIIATYHVASRGRYGAFSIAASVAVLFFGCWNLAFGQGEDINTYTLVLGALVSIVYCVLYLYHLLAELPVQKLHRLPMFWINAGYLTYFAGALFLFVFASYLVEEFNNTLMIYWTFQNVLRIVQFILIIVGLWQDLRNIRLRSSLP